jgi:hypothetical protein
MRGNVEVESILDDFFEPVVVLIIDFILIPMAVELGS